MAKLVLYDDDGHELFAREISRQGVYAFAGWIRRHLPALRALADFRRAVTDMAGHLEQLTGSGRRRRGR